MLCGRGSVFVTKNELFYCLLLFGTSLVGAKSIVDKSRIVGGGPAESNSRPFQAALFIDYEASGKRGFCGGSLVSQQHVLTAAHCHINPAAGTATRYVVVLGAHSWYDQEAGTQRAQATQAIVHPDWNPDTLQNDLALVILVAPFTLTSNLQIISLPPPGLEDMTGRAVIMSGWGKLADNVDFVSPTLHEMTSTVTTSLYCNRYYFDLINTTTQICTTGNNGRSACQGDNGGPLTLVLNQETIQVGVVSWLSVRGCEAGYPSVYTRLSAFTEWIQSVIEAPVTHLK